MGLSYLVYPGAQHTRFHHALGSMHLMRQAIEVLRFKGVAISGEEERGLLAAILLHDIGHGPYSHALEGVIVEGCTHEDISLMFMEKLNAEFDGQLDIAISIFKGEYKRKFLNQLVSSQLDMDRLDYLRRDSFFTGVAEGNISSQRLISMLTVYDGELVVEEKGIYSVEKFLMARRFMYWQVYFHKTSLVAELMLIGIVMRAKQLIENGSDVSCSPALAVFLSQRQKDFDSTQLELFSKLDDVDVMAALKAWQYHEDNVLSSLSAMLLDRRLLKIKLRKNPLDKEGLEQTKRLVKSVMQIEDAHLDYFVFTGKISNRAYNQKDQNINILRKNGKLIDVAKASDHFSLKALSKKVVKYYHCCPKEIL